MAQLTSPEKQTDNGFEKIEWSPEYQTGNPMVDLEHHELISLANMLGSAEMKERCEAVLEETLSALHHYVNRHFINEENLLEALSSKYFAKQRLQHNSLRNELNAFWSPGEAAASPETVHELVLWVQHRLVRHFIIHDREAFLDKPFAEGEYLVDTATPQYQKKMGM